MHGLLGKDGVQRKVTLFNLRMNHVSPGGPTFFDYYILVNQLI